MAHLGLHASRLDDHRGRAAGDLRVHERHVDAIAQSRISGHWLYLLRYRRALAGQGRFIDLEGGGMDDSPIGRHQVARLDHHDVAGHEVDHVDYLDFAAAPDARLDDHHLLQRGDARLGFTLLAHAQEGVEQSEPYQHDAGGELIGNKEADDAGDQQNDLHRIGVLAQENAEARLARCVSKPV